jgi:serine/threonine protein kinase
MDSGGPTPGDTLGPYKLEGVLGEGAMGIVFRAIDETGAPVALKVLRPRLSSDESYVRRFLHEARAAQDVEHSHLLRVVDAGAIDGRHYLVTPYIAGGSLDGRLTDERGLALDEVSRLARQLAGALDTLHRAELVHRDVKPSNVMLDAVQGALLGDFGLARGPAYTVLTEPGQVVGTLDYLAPELILGREATPATDLYAFGCVVFECVAGAPPFAGRGVLEVGSAHMHEEPPDPGRDRRDATDAFSEVVLRALAKRPEDRPPSATAYAHMLRLSLS